jgi:multimeric flavodoxin WrbA
MKPKILGIAASLRNARWGAGNESLVNDLSGLKTEQDLKKYLTEQADLHLQNFVDSGRSQGLSFDAIYKNLKQCTGDRGLSNSEVALAAGLWSALQLGCDIDHMSLSEYFPAADVARNLEELKQRLREADGILLSGPVYFGDRGSLAQELVDLIRNDQALQAALQNKVYAGIAVGAKRNGGQETTLIYQLLDMIHAGLLGVGNDSETTAQYGGTGHAGDVGTMNKDEYGLWTSMGAGRRLAKVAKLVSQGRRGGLRGKVRIMFWILQDRAGAARDYVARLVAAHTEHVEATIIQAAGQHVTRCIACDICPTHVDVDGAYRCIIKTKRDGFVDWHTDFADQDAVVPVVYSTGDRRGLTTNYQTFIERTRYLRRGDYLFSDAVTAPLVLQDLGVHESMEVRMVTSVLRHHTIVTEPMVAYLSKGVELNPLQVAAQYARFVNRTQLVVAGRLRCLLDAYAQTACKYNPVGYVLSTEKDKEDEKLRARETMQADRKRRQIQDAVLRMGTETAVRRAG